MTLVIEIEHFSLDSSAFKSNQGGTSFLRGLFEPDFPFFLAYIRAIFQILEPAFILSNYYPIPIPIPMPIPNFYFLYKYFVMFFVTNLMI